MTRYLIPATGHQVGTALLCPEKTKPAIVSSALGGHIWLSPREKSNANPTKFVRIRHYR